MSRQAIPVKVGSVVHVGEPDYMYGTGELRLRVTAVGHVQRLNDGLWLHLRGIELRADGTRLHAHERFAFVRVSAIQVREAE